MEKKTFIFWGLILITAGFLLFKALQPEPIWKVNAQEFSNSFNIISGKQVIIDDLSGFTNFEWDTLYSFAPYTSEERVYQTVGYRWDKINSTVSEGMNQVVFLNNSKVVCYIDGYPEEYDVYFDFGQYKSHYIKLTASNILTFNMKVNDDGIRNFTYINAD